jgi:putative hemolysin
MEDKLNSLPHSPEPLIIPEGTMFTDTLLKLFKHKNLEKLYSESSEKDPVSLINAILENLKIKIEVPEEDIANIPSSGPFIAVSNHPFRGIDSMILMKMVHSKRNDFKILGSKLLYETGQLKDVIIPVNTLENPAESFSSIKGLREAVEHLKNGHCLGIFPTADDTVPWISPTIIIDPEWNHTVIKLTKIAGVPVVPVYFHGTRNRIGNIFSKMNILPGKAALPEELRNKKKREIRVRIGASISAKELSEFTDIIKLTRYLRARVYSLGKSIETPGKGRLKLTGNRTDTEPIVERVDEDILEKEVEEISKEYKLFETKNYSVLCAPVNVMPELFREIGRLREITFREVGEGTGKSIDIDEYDFYYYHLFIWDSDAKKIVGAYRLGKGREIMTTYGKSGFYINSLFGIRDGLNSILGESVELGRSFITRDYQKKVIPLFLLWKGIMVFILRNPDYRYLIGPVSITNDLSTFSKTLIVDFIKKYFYNEDLAKFVVPKKEFKTGKDKSGERSVLIDNSERDINKIEKVIIDVEPGYRIPVLVKKYLEINGRIIGFNIDPDFNNCIDGLLILDLYDIPDEFLKGLSREMNDPSILERFNK